MKIAATIARYLLGLIFLIFGLNHYLNFIPMGPMPTGLAGQFMGALMQSHYMYVVAFFEVVPAILLLVNRYVPLALTFLAPVIFNILLVGILMIRDGIAYSHLCHHPVVSGLLPGSLRFCRLSSTQRFAD